MISTWKLKRGVALALAFRPDSERLAAAVGDAKNRGKAGQIERWDLKAKQPLPPLTGHSKSPLGLSYSPDGKHLISAGADRYIAIWDPQRNQIQKYMRGHRFDVESLSFSPDGAVLATGGSDRTLRLFSLETNQLNVTLEDVYGAVTHVHSHPLGRAVVTANIKGMVTIWRADAPAIHHRFSIGDMTRTIAVSDDNSTVYLAGDNKTSAFDLRNGKKKLSFIGHTNRVYCLDVSSNGKTLATSSRDKTIRLWNTNDGTCRLTIRRLQSR